MQHTYLTTKIILDTADVLFKLNIKINLLLLHINNEYFKEYFLTLCIKHIYLEL